MELTKFFFLMICLELLKEFRNFTVQFPLQTILPGPLHRGHREPGDRRELKQLLLISLLAWLGLAGFDPRRCVSLHLKRYTAEEGSSSVS